MLHRDGLKKDVQKLLHYGKQFQKLATFAKIKLPDGCVDGVITDHMFFLADFNQFYINKAFFC